MPSFPQLSKEDVDAIFEYIATAPAPGAQGGGGPAGDTAAQSEADSSRNALIFGIISLILAIVALILMQVNSNLKKLSDDKEGVPAYEPIPFYRNKTYITLLTLILFVVGGFYVVRGAIG